MKLKYHPISSTYNSVISCHDDTITIDGKDYTFPAKSVAWPDVSAQTDGAIIEAHRENGILYATVLRRHTGSWQAWYSPDYVEVKE